MGVTYRRSWLLGLVVAGLVVAGAGLSPDPDPFERGVQAYRDGAYEQARRVLRTVFSEHPAHAQEPLGTAAFWLGKAYRKCGHPDSTAWAWSKGVAAMNRADRFDARLFDAYLQMEMRREDPDLERATDVYLALLRQTVRNAQTERTILRRHVARALPLLGKTERVHVLEGDGEGSDGSWQVRSNGGGWLASWWHHQDTRPATARNERLEEHLRRVAYADSAYAYEEDPARWDDRGDLYVRYGAPERVHDIPFDDLQFLREIQRLGVSVDRGDFPANAIWRYPAIGKEGAYLFVKREGRFQLSSAKHLMPLKLSGHFHSSERSRARAYSSLATMRYIYRYLSMHYQDRGNVYSQVSSYLDNLEGLARIRSLRGESGAPGSRLESPSTAANSALRKSERHERTFARQREATMPQQNGRLKTPGTELPVSVRTARFLNEDGTTRTEVYWGSPVDPSAASPRPYVLHVSARRYDRDYRRATQAMKRYVVRPSTTDRGFGGTTRKTEVQGGRGLYHLSMQWNRYTVSDSAGKIRPKEWTGRRIIRLDSLQALPADSTRLGMSDLRPMVPAGQNFTATHPTEEARPYPFSELNPKTPLLLYFEVYHLAYTAENRTRYEVAYEVERTTNDGGFLGLFGGKDVERTQTASTYTGTGPRAAETILVDWGDVSAGDATSLTITVRVTDETSGQTVERSIDFEVAPRKG